MATSAHTVPSVNPDRLVRPSWMVGGPECDWHEDAPYENGNYYNKCFTCQADFIGHKRRCWCRKCHLEMTSNYGAMTPEEKAAHDAKVAAAIKDFWTNEKTYSSR